MIHACPNCGIQLTHPLKDGLTHCSHCNHRIESSELNKLLSAAWLLRRKNMSIDQLKWLTNFSDDYCLLVYTFVVENGYSHDSFLKFLKNLGVSQKSY
jgi:hypothetical protein